MSNMSDDDISREQPTEAEEDRDAGGHGGQDTGDEPTESEEDLDMAGEGERDTGDQA